MNRMYINYNLLDIEVDLRFKIINIILIRSSILMD